VISSVAETAQILQLILAPVVMITTCSIMLGAMFGHYQAINDRLRAFARERLDLVLGDAPPGRLMDERLEQIDDQLPSLLRRLQQSHDAVLLLFVAIAIFVASMLAIGAATVSGSPVVANSVLLLFLIGVVVLLLAVLNAAREVRTSHEAVRYEVNRIRALTRDDPELDPSGADP
jgi:Flp pilus assembly protein TadB